jgi:uncharacterized membrane protein
MTSVVKEAQAIDDQQRLLAAVSHFAILGGFWLVVPVAIYLWKRETSRFVAFHALQATLLAIAAVPLSIAVIVLAAAFGLGALLVFGGDGGTFALEVILVWGAVCVSGSVTAVLAIIAGVKALRGETWSMPILGPLAQRVIDAKGAS